MRSMRILLANDGFGDAGGVQNYLDSVAGGLAARGHELALLHRDATPAPFAGGATSALPCFSTAAEGIQAAVDRLASWAPDICFSHNMNVLDIDRALIARWPVVKFMHGYFGTCIGGQKRFGFPGRPALRPPVRRGVSGALCAAPLRGTDAGSLHRTLRMGARSARAVVAVSHHRRRERAHEARVRPQRRPVVADSGESSFSNPRESRRTIRCRGYPLNGRSHSSGE